jgi:hypothetical protein
MSPPNGAEQSAQTLHPALTSSQMNPSFLPFVPFCRPSAFISVD